MAICDDVSKERKSKLIAMSHRGSTSTWREQIEATGERKGKWNGAFMGEETLFYMCIMYISSFSSS